MQQLRGGRIPPTWRTHIMPVRVLPTVADVERSGKWVSATTAGIKSIAGKWRETGMLLDRDVKRVHVELPRRGMKLARDVTFYRRAVVNRLRASATTRRESGLAAALDLHERNRRLDI